MPVKEQLSQIVGSGNIIDDPKILEINSSNCNFVQPIKPCYIIKPLNVSQVQEIVKWANQTGTHLVPMSSGLPHFHGDAVPSIPEAVIIDLNGMKKILSINRRNRIAIIEPGVTYSELQPALAKAGLRLSSSLLPRANKSVITSLLEREPRLNCRYQWSSMDPLRSMEIIFGDGNRLWSGDAGNDVKDLEKQWSQEKRQVQAIGPGQISFHKLLGASQGSLGIVTWASVKCEVLPKIHKFFFVPGKKLDALLDFTYKLLKFRYADELFIMNNANLACALGDNPQHIKILKDTLPAWAVIVGIAGRTELPEERVTFQEKDIREIAEQYNLDLLPAIAGISGDKALQVFLNPSREPYWKTVYKGNCQDIFFVTTLSQAPEFLKVMHSTAESSFYSSSDIGVYLQPRHQGANIHCEFNIPYNSNQPEETSRIQQLYFKASKAMLDQGAFFTRPYGIWADLAFSRDESSTRLLRHIKSIFDPNGIMNPGKLCFKVKEER